MGATVLNGRDTFGMLVQQHSQHLARFRISPEILETAGVRSVTDADARETLGLNGHCGADLGGILFPYLLPLTGARVGGRIRLDHPLPEDGGKYISEPGCRHYFFPPQVANFLADVSIPVVIVEAEKSTLALHALSDRAGRPMLPIAVGGCWGWQRTIGKRPSPEGGSEPEKGPGPDLDFVVWEGREAIVTFDSNSSTNPQVQHARRALARELYQRGARVLIATVPTIAGVNGPDDLIAVSGDEAMVGVLESAQPFEVSSSSSSEGDSTRHARRNWPEPPDKAALYGLAGDIVRTIEPHTESSPVALLVQVLVCFGSMVGRTGHFVAEGSQHFLNLFAVLVGVTSGGRKGSSWAQVLSLFRHVDCEWTREQLQSGLSSGEGLIWAVRDPIFEHKPIREKGRVISYEDVESDRGVADKRLLVFESEFASPLRMMARDGNILSIVIRQAWDTGELRTLTKNSPTRATNAHISIMGHITRDELRRELSTTDMGNGFANRFLWLCTARSKELPEGGSLTYAELLLVATRVCDAVAFARQVREMRRDASATEMWKTTYHDLTAETSGLLGAVVSRAAPQVMRLACLYALLDHSAVVRAEHLLAAIALWEYCEGSARFIFGDALGDPTADTILEALRNALDGLDRTAISSLFARHKRAEEISRALAVLQEHGLARVQPRESVGIGRPSEVWFAIANTAKEAK